jgi:uncharacterized protein YkwD
MRYLLLAPLLALVLWLAFNAPSNIKAPVIPTPTLQPTSLNKDKLWSLIQDWRKSQGLPPYIEDQKLCEIARDRVKAGNDDHQGLISKMEVNYYHLPQNQIIAENYNIGATTEDATLRYWLNSPSHLEALKHPYRFSCLATREFEALQIFSNF